MPCHKAGDEVLKSLGALLRSEAREGDIPCRYGGEEFVLVSPHMHLDVAKQRIEQWVEAFGGMKTRHGELEIGTTMSVGLATYTIHGATAEALIVRADEALYKAKAAGRNRLEIAVTD